MPKIKLVRRPATRKRVSAKQAVSCAGVVSRQIQNFKPEAAAGMSPGKLIEAIRIGLPVQELDALQTSLDVPMDKLAPRLGISKATLHRRKAQGRLAPEESDRVLRFARLMGKAAEVMEGEAAARRWLSSPQVGLGGAVPLDYAETEVGAREVEDLLGRIEYGVYS
jgi:putative toxin-antitoxin system antitoxin component (TIGR02293 family)